MTPVVLEPHAVAPSSHAEIRVAVNVVDLTDDVVACRASRRKRTSPYTRAYSTCPYTASTRTDTGKTKTHLRGSSSSSSGKGSGGGAADRGFEPGFDSRFHLEFFSNFNSDVFLAWSYKVIAMYPSSTEFWMVIVCMVLVCVCS